MPIRAVKVEKTEKLQPRPPQVATLVQKGRASVGQIASYIGEGLNYVSEISVRREANRVKQREITSFQARERLKAEDAAAAMAARLSQVVTAS